MENLTSEYLLALDNLSTQAEKIRGALYDSEISLYEASTATELLLHQTRIILNDAFHNEIETN